MCNMCAKIKLVLKAYFLEVSALGKRSQLVRPTNFHSYEEKKNVVVSKLLHLHRDRLLTIAKKIFSEQKSIHQICCIR